MSSRKGIRVVLAVGLGMLAVSPAALAGKDADNIMGRKAPQVAVSQWITNNAPDFNDLCGRVYAVEFWATWCRPCVANVPHLIELANKYRPQGLELVALSADNSPQKVTEFVSQKGINYHVGMDKGTRDWYHVRYYPTAAVVDHRGIVVWQGFPWDVGFEKAIVQALEAAPKPLLTGIDLGPFEIYRKALGGGARFASTYKLIEAHASDEKEPKTAEAARRIVYTIDSGIEEMTKRADSLRAEKPVDAFEIYAYIAAQYGGIAAAEPAMKAWGQIRYSESLRLAALSEMTGN